MEKVIKSLGKGYKIVETDTRGVEFGGIEGWISYWIVDKDGDDIETFSSAVRAENWWAENKDTIDESFDGSVERLAKNLTGRMGLKWGNLSDKEKKEWIEECTD